MAHFLANPYLEVETLFDLLSTEPFAFPVGPNFLVRVYNQNITSIAALRKSSPFIKP